MWKWVSVGFAIGVVPRKPFSLRHIWSGLTLPLMTLRRTLGVVFFVSLFSLQALAASPFDLRALKGLWWEGLPNYRKPLPWVAEHHENFLMFCFPSSPASGKD